MSGAQIAFLGMTALTAGIIYAIPASTAKANKPFGISVAIIGAGFITMMTGFTIENREKNQTSQNAAKSQQADLRSGKAVQLACKPERGLLDGNATYICLPNTPDSAQPSLAAIKSGTMVLQVVRPQPVATTAKGELVYAAR